ncbi:bis-aminopropyl spermidine synthase family protein [Frankia sp. AgB32]|uniref:bis-aminopropyl spermidine synthase family protein n=1 Tax=Frankia sp. AgB32 TaxID=631119 RepID=UPI00200D355D|nr:bis-aminopropyl spermidine synthase family protein [Frankia sp. AgB32]MCK9894535.1 bis-aminopropyl spermidine synthase family protein [Frankia sp. AgB32]
MGAPVGESAAGAGRSSAAAGGAGGPGVKTTTETTDVAPSGAGGAPGAPGESLATLLHDYRVHAKAPRRVVAALTERPRTLRELVQETGLPRRSVEEILACLGDDLRPAAGERQVLRAGAVDHYRTMIDYTGLRASTPIDPLAVEIHRHGALVTAVHELIAAAPRPRAELDHVPATAATVVRRAVWLASRYDLREGRLLCVGDHDLTSLAVALLAKRDAGHGAAAASAGPAVTVVDIDEELLEYLDRSARSLGVRLQCRYADLRFGLPPSLAGSADLVFTDPPYTPAGVSLFAARGAQALADRDRGRVLVAYGYSTRTPALGAKVQRALLDQGFVFEAVWPDFHTYDGAEAVGARAAMYICQPTPATWKRLDRPADREPVPTTIYTRGRQSEEGRSGELPAPVLDAAGRFLAAAAPARSVFVGERPALDATHTRLATVLDRGLPPVATAGAGGVTAVVADLTDDPGPWLTRLLLAVNADRLALIVDAAHPDLRPGSLSGHLRAKWTATPELDSSPAAGSRTRLVTFAATDPATLAPGELLARRLLDRPHGRLGNVWRDGLIRLVRDRTGRVLTQREALALVRGATGDGDLLVARLIDLPRQTLAATLDAAAATAGLAGEPAPPTT